MKRLFAAFILLLGTFHYHGQINCPDSVLYAIYNYNANYPKYISVYKPSQPVSATNPSFTSIPNPPFVANYANPAAGLALLPNLNGGSPSPAFYSILKNFNVAYWNGSVWVDTGHLAAPIYTTSNGYGGFANLTGCNGTLYNLVFNTSTNVFELWKYTGVGNATLLKSFPSNVSFGTDIQADCQCNLFLMDNKNLYKYSPTGTLLATITLTLNISQSAQSNPSWFEAFAMIGNDIYVTTSAGDVLCGEIKNGGVFIDTCMKGNNAQYFVGIDLAACPATTLTHVSAVINSNTLGCVPITASLVVTATTSPLVYNWAGPGIASSSFQNTIAVSSPGTYSCHITQPGCDYQLNDLVTLVSDERELIQPVVTPSANRCFEYNLHLYSSYTSAMYNNSWSGNCVVNGASTPTVLIGASGNYTLTVTNFTNGCSGSVTGSILPSPMLTLGLSSKTLCVLSTDGRNQIQISPIGSNSYTLFASQGFSIPVHPNQPIILYQLLPYNKQGGIGSVTLVGTNGVCTTSTSASFTLLPQNQVSILPTNTTVCQGAEQVFYAQGAISYTWSPDLQVKEIVAGQYVIRIDGERQYTVGGTDAFQCLMEPITVSVNVHDPVYGRLDMKARSLCQPTTVRFSFVPLDNSIAINSTWQIQKTVISGSVFSQAFSDAGDYSIAGFITDLRTGCINEQDFMLTVFPKPVATFEFLPRSPVELLDEVRFFETDTGEVLNKTWYVGDNDAIQNETTSKIFDQAGIYPVTLFVINRFGCSDTLTKAIKIEEDIHVYVPSSFTPNGDEKNDFYRPIVSGIVQYQFTIFDRWGKKVFEGDINSKGWDGLSDGISCPQGEYVWKLELKTRNFDRIVKEGFVVLYR